MSLALAETIPTVTVLTKPKGLPIAIAQLPTLTSSELPQLTAFNLISVLTLSNAKSVLASAPINLA